jgi:hypothetical protein
MTEDAYCRDLSFIVDVVMPKTMAFLPPPVFLAIFENVQELLAFVKIFASQLKENGDNDEVLYL